jgi:Na+(H+)/acetate symporter ActP
MDNDFWALATIGAFALTTLCLSFFGSRNSSVTTDFLQARKGVRAGYNAAAISGEYLSAASFLGVAGMVLKDGVNALWFPIGFTAGYFALLLFVAAPLRRTGVYSLPDFAEARLNSTTLRGLCTAFVVIIGWLYLVPQFQGAGLTLSLVTGQPFEVGALVVVAVVLIGVLSGGLRVITLVQAFQYWLKLFAISLPAFVLFVVFLTDKETPYRGLSDERSPVFTERTTVDVTAPVVVRVGEVTRLDVHGVVNNKLANGSAVWTPEGIFRVAEGTKLIFPARAAVPTVLGAPMNNSGWLRPSDDLGGLLRTYSLIVATFLGTMGLPHVLVRFYSNSDGRQARRTTLYVLVLLGLFFLAPTIFGALSRLYVPKLLVTGRTDAAVLMLPTAMLDNWVGVVLGSMVAAGAFAAFVSTASGLVVSVAGVLTENTRHTMRNLPWGAALACLVPLGIALIAPDKDLAVSVGMVFAVAASTFCPMLLLGIWWRRLTAVGVAAGMVLGGGLTLICVTVSWSIGNTGGWRTIFEYPALVTVPLSFLVMVGVSRVTQHRRPADVSRVMLRMHAPERLRIRDRDVRHFGVAGDPGRLRRGKHRR